MPQPQYVDSLPDIPLLPERPSGGPVRWVRPPATMEGLGARDEESITALTPVDQPLEFTDTLPDELPPATMPSERPAQMLGAMGALQALTTPSEAEAGFDFARLLRMTKSGHVRDVADLLEEAYARNAEGEAMSLEWIDKAYDLDNDANKIVDKAVELDQLLKSDAPLKVRIKLSPGMHDKKHIRARITADDQPVGDMSGYVEGDTLNIESTAGAGPDALGPRRMMQVMHGIKEQIPELEWATSESRMTGVQGKKGGTRVVKPVRIRDVMGPAIALGASPFFGTGESQAAGVPPVKASKYTDTLPDVATAGGEFVDSIPDEEVQGPYATTLETTVEEQSLNGGKPTNIPLLVPGQRDVAGLVAGNKPTREQMGIALGYAAKFPDLFPSYDTVDEATEASQRSSNAKDQFLEQYRAQHPGVLPDVLPAVPDDALIATYRAIIDQHAKELGKSQSETTIPVDQDTNSPVESLAKWTPTLIRIGVPIVLGVAAGPGLLLAGGIGVGTEALAEAIEYYRKNDRREQFNPTQIATQGVLNAIMFPLQFPGVKSLLGRMLLRSTQGALYGGTSYTATQLAETGTVPDAKSILWSSALGSTLGLPFGIIEARSMKAKRIADALGKAVTPTEEEVANSLAKNATTPSPEGIEPVPLVPATQPETRTANVRLRLKFRVPEGDLEERFAQLAAQRKNGFEIAKELGIDMPTLRAMRRKMNVPRTDSPLFEQWEAAYKLMGKEVAAQPPLVQVATAGRSEASMLAQQATSKATGSATASADKQAETALELRDKLFEEAAKNINPRQRHWTETALARLWFEYLYRDVRDAMRMRGGVAEKIGASFDNVLEMSEKMGGQSVLEWKKALATIPLPEQQERVRLVLDGRADYTTLRDQTEKDAHNVMRALFDQVKAYAEHLGVGAEAAGKTPQISVWNPRTRKYEPFRGIESYFPRMLKRSMLDENSPLRKQIADEMIANGLDPKHVNDVIGDAVYFSKQRNRRMGSLETGRTGIELPAQAYETDLDTVGTMYFTRSWRRLAEVTEFGQGNAHDYGYKLAHHMTDLKNSDPDMVRFIEQVYDRFMGLEGKPEPGERVARSLARWTALIALSPRSTLKHVGQTVNTIVRTDLFSFVEALRNIKASKEETQRAGLYLREALGDAWGAYLNESYDIGTQTSTQAFSQKLLNKYTQGIGLTPLFRFNQALGFGAGMAYADSLATRLIANPKNAGALRQVARLGLDADELVRAKSNVALARRGTNESEILAAEQELTQLLRVAGKRVSVDAAFKQDVLNSPWAFQTPTGRIFFQFHLFGLKQARFEIQHVLSEARHGNVMPLATLVTGGLLVGEASADLREVLLNRNPSTGQPLVGNEVSKEKAEERGKGGILAQYLAGRANPTDAIQNFMGIGYLAMLQEALHIAGLGVGGSHLSFLASEDTIVKNAEAIGNATKALQPHEHGKPNKWTGRRTIDPFSQRAVQAGKIVGKQLLRDVPMISPNVAPFVSPLAFPDKPTKRPFPHTR